MRCKKPWQWVPYRLPQSTSGQCQRGAASTIGPRLYMHPVSKTMPHVSRGLRRFYTCGIRYIVNQGYGAAPLVPPAARA